ncbi:MAG: hypothetical protein EON59_07985 [Alphaproteobacteria bacterium]|nr:MAG: hypothetical protein EON59_07985 [Alphaproteobacteria bacterium]
MRVDFSIAIAVLFVILLAVVLLWGADLIGGPPALRIPEVDQPETPERLVVLLAATDQAVTMLTTLALSLVVLVGFGWKLAEGRPSSITTVDRVAGFGFVLALFLTFFFGFGSRRLAFELANSEYRDWSSIQITLNSQAVLLVIDAGFGFYLTARSLGRMRKPVETNDGALQSLNASRTTSRQVASQSNAAAPGAIEKQAGELDQEHRRKGAPRNA